MGLPTAITKGMLPFIPGDLTQGRRGRSGTAVRHDRPAFPGLAAARTGRRRR